MFTPKVSSHRPQATKAFVPRKRQYPARQELKDLQKLGHINNGLHSPELVTGISKQIAQMGRHPQRRVSERLGDLYALAARAKRST